MPTQTSGAESWGASDLAPLRVRLSVGDRSRATQGALPTIPEGVAIDDPRYALRAVFSPPRAEGLGATNLVTEQSATRALELFRGLGVFAAATTKLAKSSSQNLYVAGGDAASLAMGISGVLGHGTLALNDLVSAFRAHRSILALTDLLAVLQGARVEAANAGRSGDELGRFMRAERVFEEVISTLRSGRHARVIDALVHTHVAAGAALYAASIAAAQWVVPVSLLCLAFREAQHARHGFHDAHAMAQRLTRVDRAVDSGVSAANAQVERYNARAREMGMPDAKPFSREDAPVALRAFADKEMRRLRARRDRLRRRGVYDATTAAGAGVAAVGYFCGEPITATTGYAVMAFGSSLKGMESLARAVTKSSRHAKREEVYARLKALLLEGSPEEKVISARTIGYYTSDLIHSEDLLLEPEQAIDFLRALEKRPLTQSADRSHG